MVNNVNYSFLLKNKLFKKIRFILIEKQSKSESREIKINIKIQNLEIFRT